MNDAVSHRHSSRQDRAEESQETSTASSDTGVEDSEQSEGTENRHRVATSDGSVDLEANVETDPETGETSIEATGTALVGDDNRPVKVTVRTKVDENGKTSVTVDTHGEKLSAEESDDLLTKVTREMAIDLKASAGINRETHEGLLGVSEGASTSAQVTSSSQGGQTVETTYTPSVEGMSMVEQSEAEGEADRRYQQSQQQARDDFDAAGGDAGSYSGGGAGSSTSADDGVINDSELKGLASNSDFQYRSQGNVEGNYFSKTANGIMAEVSTADRRPGFWNGNRAEIAFNKRFRSSDTTGFRSFFDIHAGSNFSIFQLFNQSGKEGFPEAMVKVVDGKLVLGGRAFGGKNIVLGALPDGKFGIDVKFSGGKVSVQLLDASGEPVGSGHTASLTQPGGEFHYRAGPYFDGYNNKQFGSDMKNMTAKVEIIDPTMIG
jgi:hypothetical protein